MVMRPGQHDRPARGVQEVSMDRVYLQRSGGYSTPWYTGSGRGRGPLRRRCVSPWGRLSDVATRIRARIIGPRRAGLSSHSVHYCRPSHTAGQHTDLAGLGRGHRVLSLRCSGDVASACVSARARWGVTRLPCGLSVGAQREGKPQSDHTKPDTIALCMSLPAWALTWVDPPPMARSHHP